MKIRIAIIILTSMLSGSLLAQVSPEHTYDGNAYFTNLSISGPHYYVLENPGPKVNIYNTEHTLWKSIDLDVPTGWTAYWTGLLSEMLFSLDGQLGLFYSYYESPSMNYQGRVILEDGTILATIDGATSAYIVNTGENESKLLVFCSTGGNTTTKVYSVPGHLTGEKTPPMEILPDNPFPNPVSEMIFVPVSLPDGHKEGNIKICNISGITVREFPVQRNEGLKSLNLSDMAPGVYFYQVVSGDYRSETKKFIKSGSN